MKGKILAVATDTATGLISGNDGQRYSFDAKAIKNGVPRPRQEVDFETISDKAENIYLVNNIQILNSLDWQIWLKFYFLPFGRVSRKQYWLYGILMVFLALVILSRIPILGPIITLAVLWSSIALSFKRCHDVGRTGWWSLVTTIPLMILLFYRSEDVSMGMIYSAGYDSWFKMIVFLFILTLGSYVFLSIVIYARRGNIGPNRFGGDPAEQLITQGRS